MKKGEQYFTFWQTGLSGPHTFVGDKPYCEASFITGNVQSLSRANTGFKHMLSIFDFDQSNGEFAEQIPTIIAVDAIEAEFKAVSDPFIKSALAALLDERHKFPRCAL